MYTTQRILPKGWRSGQLIFNFLEWLHKEKGYDNDQSHRMADPFQIDVDEWNKLLDEYWEVLKEKGLL